MNWETIGILGIFWNFKTLHFTSKDHLSSNYTVSNVNTIFCKSHAQSVEKFKFSFDVLLTDECAIGMKIIATYMQSFWVHTQQKCLGSTFKIKHFRGIQGVSAGPFRRHKAVYKC